DLALPADRAALRHSLPLGDGIELHLYELPKPNITGFSPRKLSPPLAWPELSKRIAAQPAVLETEAFTEPLWTHEPVPGGRSQLRFERGGVHVTARSAGRSALLLPVQFSHCFRPVGADGDRVIVQRANAIHTLIIFAGELDLRLRWQFSFWRNNACRARDAADAAALGLD